MILLGLDLASRLSGYCVGDGAGLPEAGAWAFPSLTDEDGTDYGLMLEVLETYLDTVFDRFDVGAVAYEAPILITHANKNREYVDTLHKLRLLYPLGPFVEWYCRTRKRVPCHEIPVPEVKTEVTGDSNAKKEDIAFVAERCGVVLPKVGRLDGADAWAVWKRLLRHYDPAASARWDSRIYGSRGGLL